MDDAYKNTVSSLEARLKEDLKISLKKGDAAKTSTLRMLLSEIKNKMIEKQGKQPLSDPEIVAAIQKMVRRHKESIEQFRKGGREGLAKKETEELGALECYLPEPLSREEIVKAISDIISLTGASSIRDMGRVMKGLLPLIVGRADTGEVSLLVKEQLEQG